MAWQPEQLPMAIQILLRRAVSALEITPGVFDKPLGRMDAAQLRERRYALEKNGLRIWSMQSLLFGCDGAPALFCGGESGRKDLFLTLALMIRQAAVLGVRRLVFGSPKQRRRGSLSVSSAYHHAAVFFRQVGDEAAQHGCVLCLEPNAKEYGSDWLETHRETAELVELIAHPSIRLQADTGALEMTGEDPQILQHLAPLVGHAHISCASLRAIGEMSVDSAWHIMTSSALTALHNGGYRGCVSLEMLGGKDIGNNLPQLDLALATMQTLLDPRDDT